MSGIQFEVQMNISQVAGSLSIIGILFSSFMAAQSRHSVIIIDAHCVSGDLSVFKTSVGCLRTCFAQLN